MAEIVDFNSKKRLDQMKQDYGVNDAKAAGGRYIGKLPKHEAYVIRDIHEQLARKRFQIDQMVKEFDSLWEGASYSKSGALSFLGIGMEEFNVEAQELYVDKEGHSWIVNLDDPVAAEFVKNKETAPE